MSRKFSLIFGAICLAVSSLCSAGGSVEFKVVDLLIRQQPTLYIWLSSPLVLPDAAYAEVRFGSHFKYLGGGRMGPYTFMAKPIASSTVNEIEIIVCTKARFLDKTGKQLPDSDIDNAVRLEENLASVQVRDSHSDIGRPVCPE